MGADDAIVACGSDDGHVFLYDAQSGALLRALQADEDVANCVQVGVGSVGVGIGWGRGRLGWVRWLAWCSYVSGMAVRRAVWGRIQVVLCAMALPLPLPVQPASSPPPPPLTLPCVLPLPPAFPVVQCHPTLPVLATSGIESVIRLWAPGHPGNTPLASDVQEQMEGFVARNQERMRAGPSMLR